ncbi:class I SAM-dependent methyltransferase [Pseudalkalibacillus sp. Hm43]|uniref:class I SAM-dependent methyltransferase n=1 Tax=Pseudalkalibacillus sp. Hm43 TaxID=3450742 RepID=UPI003F44161D
MSSDIYSTQIHNLAVAFQEQAIPYQFINETALSLQGIDLESDRVCVEVQWDVFETVYDVFAPYHPSPVEQTTERGAFHFKMEDVTVDVSCRYNTTIRTNRYRIEVENSGASLWCQSLYDLKEDPRFEGLVASYLADQQARMTNQNESAWNQNTYEALVNRHGTPEVAAEKIKRHPAGRLGSLYPQFGSLEGKKVVHLMGSNGIKGVAMSLLGADVTVVDFSKENAAYAQEVAESSGVELDYRVADVLSFETENHYDVVMMELGVLHYFIDLKPLMSKVQALLKPGGKFILQEFHPISTKLITSKGKKHKVDGNYFDPTIERRGVAFSKYSSEGKKEENEVLQRKWTLGEVVTEIAQQGLVVKMLDEETNQKVHDIGLPKMFTLVAEKA